MQAKAYVELRFTDGEYMRIPFANPESAQQFYARAQARHDIHSARFVDQVLASAYDKSHGY